jgi:predicted ester cyclase
VSTEENKAIVVRHLKEVQEQGHVELLDSYFAVMDGAVPIEENIKGTREFFLWCRKVFPGFTIKILDMLAEGETVMAHIQFDLTYTVPAEPSPIFNSPFPPLGQPVSWRDVNIYRIVDGKMVSAQWVGGYTDMLVENGVIKF